MSENTGLPPGGALRIVRLANYVGPRSGGMRTALASWGPGTRGRARAGAVIPGPHRCEEESAQGRVITLHGPLVPFTGGYRALLPRRSWQLLTN